MMRTVDLVIAGDGSAARIAAAGALGRAQRVLVVLRSADGRVARRLRRCLRKAETGNAGQLRIITSAEVVCADGVDAVEAVVIRHVRTGRLWAVNASGFLSFDSSSQPSAAL
jgi:thioredoxin reductase